MTEINYSKTVNLPQTEFPMKGDMAQREPQWLELWKKLDLYNELQKKHKDDPFFILHDGPPYANGQIHIGHALNKVLKDIIVKFKTLSGHRSPYVPGWDCHGLPIENQLMKDLKTNKRGVERNEFRKQAAQFASKYIELQKEEFIRLGVLGDWQHPYLTMDPAYEVGTLKTFFELLEKGFIYRDKKPVYWCPYDETALADAEVEYEDKPSDSIFVRFPLGDASVLVWTTTPWTLPANVGLAFHPREIYGLIDLPEHGRCYVAEKRVGALSAVLKMDANALQKSFDSNGVRLSGADLVAKNGGLMAKNPLNGRDSKGITAEFVSMDDGTGIVHIAPGHGEDDYAAGHVQNKLPILSPVDERGRFTSDVGVPSLEGKHVLKDANEAVIQLLETSHLLVHKDKFKHSYPCCWRCKNPVIFRATEQWFLSVEKDGLRGRLIQSLDSVTFTPKYGVNRFKGMLESRPDWCLTRQRYWGTPLPMLYCVGCKKPYYDKAFQGKVLEIVSKEGSDAWFVRPVEDFLPSGAKCACGGTSFKKEEDILDVWFDSGSSWKAVLESRPEFAGRKPADPVMYLEGSDQHRGWFQTSLIPSVALTGKPPFSEILTHGFVVDGSGQKMSKSMGNVVSPQDVIKKYGADVLRLWVGYSDYASEVKASDKILEQVVDSYRRLRNTFRYLLGNLADFNPAKHAVPFEKMDEFDRWALQKTAELVRSGRQHYADYEFHKVMRAATDFCINDLSGFYLDVQKDILYCESKDSVVRRSAQTAFYEIVQSLALLLSPILSFTMEEAWIELKRMGLAQEESVFLHRWGPVKTYTVENWEKLISFRGSVNEWLEKGRQEGKWGSALEVVVTLDPAKVSISSFLKGHTEEWWGRFFLVSKVILGPVEDASGIAASKSTGGKCRRCWRWRDDIGQHSNKDLSALCLRCAGALDGMNLAEITA